MLVSSVDVLKPDELAQLSPYGCSLEDTVHRNYLITPRYTMLHKARRRFGE
jgi:hypothetical protein